MMTATMKKGVEEYSQAAYDKFVAQNIRSMKKSRAKGHRDFKSFSDEQIESAAHMLARCYNAGQVIRFVEM